MIPKSNIGKLLEFDRGQLNDGGYMHGYLLGCSDNWTFIHFVPREIFIHGYLIIRNDTIKRYCINSFYHKALTKLGQKPVSPGKIDLTDIKTIFLSTIKLFPLINPCRELLKKDKCWIGGLADVCDKTVSLKLISTNARYDGILKIRSSDITRIGFDGHYERALWALASQQTKERITSR